jgi:hypothetical protein
MDGIEARELEWQEELERRKQEEKKRRSRRHHSSDEDDEDNNDEGKKHLLAIGPPPHPPPAGQVVPPDPRVFQTIPDPQGKSMLDAPTTPIVNIVPDTYSHNV